MSFWRDNDMYSKDEYKSLIHIIYRYIFFNKTQLNEYDTAPYFLQLSQNMKSDCLFTNVFFLVLT